MFFSNLLQNRVICLSNVFTQTSDLGPELQCLLRVEEDLS